MSLFLSELIMFLFLYQNRMEKKQKIRMYFQVVLFVVKLFINFDI